MAGSSTADGLAVSRSSPAAAETGGPAFYFDFAAPEAYLAAERILAVMPVPCAWIPVRADRLPGGGVGAWRCAEEREIELAGIERRAAERGLQPVRWPPEVPFDSAPALRAATYARGGGKVVAFSLAAFRQAYAGGRDLGREENVMIAAAACEIHPRALTAGAGTAAVARQLDEATAQAAARGVRSVPAVWTGERVFHGDGEFDAAARALG